MRNRPDWQHEFPARLDTPPGPRSAGSTDGGRVPMGADTVAPPLAEVSRTKSDHEYQTLPGDGSLALLGCFLLILSATLVFAIAALAGAVWMGWLVQS